MAYITDDGNAAYYNAETFYSYDVHGNVDTLLQDYGQSTNEATKNIMNRNANRRARMVYKYDLISGKVNQVSYNPKYYDVTTGNWLKPNGRFYHRYNYDISSMAVNIKPLGTPYRYNYKYDQLNRLTDMDAFTGLDSINNNWRGITATKLYNERVSYDANGNIKRYDRYYDNPTVIMDSLRYNYAAGT